MKYVWILIYFYCALCLPRSNIKAVWSPWYGSCTQGKQAVYMCVHACARVCMRARVPAYVRACIYWVASLYSDGLRAAPVCGQSGVCMKDYGAFRLYLCDCKPGTKGDRCQTGEYEHSNVILVEQLNTISGA